MIIRVALKTSETICSPGARFLDNKLRARKKLRKYVNFGNHQIADSEEWEGRGGTPLRNKKATYQTL
jgi:hypothetical protein